MASPELSRRVEKVVGYPPLDEMSEPQRREFHEALEEQLFGHEDDLADFELEAIRAEPPTPAAPAVLEDENSESNDPPDGVPDDVDGAGAERA